MNEKILFVDDDENLLASYQRQLRNKFAVATAPGGEQGLKVIGSEGPFAVIVSDFRMPGMDGVQFLAKAREAAPDTVRVMLTGYADL
jgi:DNA-binding NtrC family response regulator